MSALPLFKRKTGVPHSRFCLFLHFFAHFCTFSRRGQALPRVHYMPKLKFAPFALFARFFIFPWARQKNVSIRFSHHSTFFCRCQYLCRKALHGRARWSVFARPLYELFSFAFPAFGSSRKSAHATFHFFAVPSLWSALFLFPFPLLCQIAAKKACSLMQWLTAPFFSPRLFPHKTIYRSPFPVYPFHLHAFAPLSAIQCPPALRSPARFRKTIMLLFL